MTAPTPDPGTNEVLAAIRAQGRVLAEISARLTQVEADQRILRDSHAEARGETRAGFDHLRRETEALVAAQGQQHGEMRAGFRALRDDVQQARADIAGVKADTAIAERYQADTHEAVVRHIADPDAHRPAA